MFQSTIPSQKKSTTGNSIWNVYLFFLFVSVWQWCLPGCTVKLGARARRDLRLSSFFFLLRTTNNTKAISVMTNTPPAAAPRTVPFEVLEDGLDPPAELELPEEEEELGIECDVRSEVADVPSPEVEFREGGGGPLLELLEEPGDGGVKGGGGGMNSPERDDPGGGGAKVADEYKVEGEESSSENRDGGGDIAGRGKGDWEDEEGDGGGGNEGGGELEGGDGGSGGEGDEELEGRGDGGGGEGSGELEGGGGDGRGGEGGGELEGGGGDGNGNDTEALGGAEEGEGGGLELVGGDGLALSGGGDAELGGGELRGGEIFPSDGVWLESALGWMEEELFDGEGEPMILSAKEPAEVELVESKLEELVEFELDIVSFVLSRPSFFLYTFQSLRQIYQVVHKSWNDPISSLPSPFPKNWHTTIKQILWSQPYKVYQPRQEHQQICTAAQQA